MDGSQTPRSPMGSIQRPDATLDDRWEKQGETVLLTGTHALVRLPLLRREMDAAIGWNTGGFISGYRGSPLGGFDRELWKQKARLKSHNIVFTPGLNEDLAATAVWGSQSTGLIEGATVEGVFAIWYGKGPGVDRSGDVFRHANSAGTSPKGGVLALAGDDPSSKSSTITSGCEYTFMDAEMPVLDPADVGEVLAFGLKGIALSRFAGVWVGVKCVADTMDASASVFVDPARYLTVEPRGLPASPDGIHIRMPDSPLAQEARLRHFKLPYAVAFARANGFDRIVIDGPRARYGIVARGKAYAMLRQSLEEAGISDAMARDLGLRLWKVGLAWPLDAEAARAFADGLDEVLVIEDRRSFLEWQLREALYHAPRRPRIVGKTDEAGRKLLSDLTELDTAQIMRALLARLPEEFRTEALTRRVAELDALAAMQAAPIHTRDPYFCPGCPHNTSTRVPEGSAALAGIGCHYLVRYMGRSTELFTQMGGEGAPWIGIEPFARDKHIFANLGDGTYGHSGSLAIRFAVASKANITYKILVNSAVAMTGGQPPEGEMTVPHIAAQVRAEGVERIEIVADDPDRHKGDPMMPPRVGFHHRSELDRVQRELREVPGVTVLIYDQECATERRRKRKRDLAPKAEKRVAINPRICEDCGDCSRASNCIAVEPIATPFGRKRAIDQSACNQDYSCVNGFCPSFVTLVGAKPAEHHVQAGGATPPDPALPEVKGGAWNLLLAGVGGQGVSGMAAILAMAAHLEGRPVRTVDQLGLAQKGGGVYAQLRIGAAGATPESIPGPRIGMGQADLLIAADMMVAQGRTARPLLGPERTVAVVNADLAPSAQFVLNTATRYDQDGMIASVRKACRELIALPGATRVVEELGDAIYLNVFLLGVAYQRGLVPLSADAINRALELNGAQVALNKEAFARGRAAALEDLRPKTPEQETLDALIARRVEDLTGYQNARYARDYAGFVETVRAAERGAMPGSERLARAAAIQLHRLMAYKDEYEVARLHSLTDWREKLTHDFTGTRRVEVHLAPPLFAKKDPSTGLPMKRAYGPWMLRAMGWLRHGKALRGTALDPFGRTEERRTERALIDEFRGQLETLLRGLNPATHATICDWVEAWGEIKGFGHIKARNLENARSRIAGIAARLDAPAMAAE